MADTQTKTHSESLAGFSLRAFLLRGSALALAREAGALAFVREAGASTLGRIGRVDRDDRAEETETGGGGGSVAAGRSEDREI